jgi:hypothetical protein
LIRVSAFTFSPRVLKSSRARLARGGASESLEPEDRILVGPRLIRGGLGALDDLRGDLHGAVVRLDL